MHRIIHLNNNKQYVIYFDGSVLTIFSNSKLFFFYISVLPYLYLNYIENEH